MAPVDANHAVSKRRAERTGLVHYEEVVSHGDDQRRSAANHTPACRHPIDCRVVRRSLYGDVSFSDTLFYERLIARLAKSAPGQR